MGIRIHASDKLCSMCSFEIKLMSPFFIALEHIEFKPLLSNLFLLVREVGVHVNERLKTIGK
jgi:hypothetical protein